MTNSEPNRLDIIEAIVESNARAIEAMLDAQREERQTQSQRQEEIDRRIDSNARTIQAMLDAQVEDRLKHEEFRSFAQGNISRLSESIARLTVVQEGVNRLLVSLDEDRPTILRRLMSIENKVDSLLERRESNE